PRTGLGDPGGRDRRGRPGGARRAPGGHRPPRRPPAAQLPRAQHRRRGRTPGQGPARTPPCRRRSTSLSRVSQTLTRREELLRVAADLFAHRGFHGVSVNDIGRAAGVSGPAIYRHFASKDAMLAEMLISISEELLRVGRERAAAANDPVGGVRALVAWHTDFALRERALIIVQDRDWSSLPDEAREQVRRLQREY